MSTEVRYADTCPEECPSAPVRYDHEPVVPCSMMRIRTGSEIIKFVDQCTRCGYTDPNALDRWAEDWYKRQSAGSGAEMRTALAAVGEPFTFVRGSDADITLSEAIGQALGAASMCWEHPEKASTFDSSRAARIFKALHAIIEEKRPATQ